MKKRTAFIGAILFNSLATINKNWSGFICFNFDIFPAKKALANSFNVDYDYAIELFDKGKYRETILECKRILKIS